MPPKKVVFPPNLSPSPLIDRVCPSSYSLELHIPNCAAFLAATRALAASLFAIASFSSCDIGFPLVVFAAAVLFAVVVAALDETFETPPPTTPTPRAPPIVPFTGIRNPPIPESGCADFSILLPTGCCCWIEEEAVAGFEGPAAAAAAGLAAAVSLS